MYQGPGGCWSTLVPTLHACSSGCWVEKNSFLLGALEHKGDTHHFKYWVDLASPQDILEWRLCLSFSLNAQ